MDQVGYDRGSTTLLTSSGNMTVYIQYLCTFKVFTARNISKKYDQESRLVMVTPSGTLACKKCEELDRWKWVAGGRGC